MSTPVWAPSTVYLPGAIVSTLTGNQIVQELPFNNSFESGLTNWTITGEFTTDGAAISNTSASSVEHYDGTMSVTVNPFSGNGSGPTAPSGEFAAYVILTNNFQAPVVPGQKIHFSARFRMDPGNGLDSLATASCGISWYDASHNFLSTSFAPGGMQTGPLDEWFLIGGLGIAPAGAAYAAAMMQMSTTSYGGQSIYGDYYTWNYTTNLNQTGLVFVATQAAAGTSGVSEPAWPSIAGHTVHDGSVTWEAEFASSVTWQANSILISGFTEPTWPLVIGGTVLDRRVEWTATDGRITDPNCPQSKIVTIASAKIYAADNDIIRYSATANAQDWSSSQDAGFIPFGLQAYGNEPCEGLGLYRSNLVAFNSSGYQMWQVDPNPANIAILDAEPVGCVYPKSIQPVNNDLVFLSPVGIRNIGTAGASGNLQAGQFGKQIDPIVKGLIKALATNGYEVKSLFYPGTGQYWIWFGPQAIVLSINGNNTMSWSRYVFPGIITDWTLGNGLLYLRVGDVVWNVSDTTLLDDMLVDSTDGGTNVGFPGYVAWNYVECGQLGVDKQMEGFDLTIGDIDDDGQINNNNVTCNVSFGYNQSNREQATEPYAVTGDTIPGTMVPIPLIAPSIQMRLDFGTGQNWGWGAANLYATPLRKP